MIQKVILLVNYYMIPAYLNVQIVSKPSVIPVMIKYICQSLPSLVNIFLFYHIIICKVNTAFNID